MIDTIGNGTRGKLKSGVPDRIPNQSTIGDQQTARGLGAGGSTVTDRTRNPERVKYTFELSNGETYILNSAQVDWMKQRYQSTASDAYRDDIEDQIRKSTGKLPTSFEKSYKGTTLDQKLFAQGLPSEKYIKDYIGAYVGWYGDGRSYEFDDQTKSYVADKFKSSWEYEYTFEDQDRKKQGLMPAAIEKKYGDNRRDYELMQQGLPPELMLSDYVGTYQANQQNAARADQFYDTVTRKLAAMPTVNDVDMQRVYFETLGSGEWDDVDAIHQKSASTEVPDNPDLSDYESAAAARRKEEKQAASGDAYVSYQDFADQYLQRKAGVLKDGVTTSAASAFSNSSSAGAATKKDAQEYVKTQPKENYVDTFASLYNSGASLTRLRDAEKTILEGVTDPTQRKAVKDEFAKYQDKYRDLKYSATAKTEANGNWWEDFKSDMADSRKRREQDRLFKSTIETPYNNGETSSVSADEAKKIFSSHLQYNKNGKPTDESVEAATAFLKTAGASAPIIKTVVRDTIGTAGDYSVADAFSSIQSDATLIDTAAVRKAATSVDVEDRTAVAESMREKLVANGTMTNYEFDQMLRRNGWSDTISDERAAADYYTEFEKPKYEANGEKMKSWDEIDAQTKAGYVQDFKENAAFNPEIHKSFDEQVEGQSIGGIFAKAYLQTLSGTVNALDMMTGGDQWEASKVLADATVKAQSYGKSNQSVGSQAFGMASDISSELVRMYALAAAGSGIASMAFGTSGAIATVAGASTTATKGINALAKVGTFLVKSSPFITTAMGGYYADALRSGASVQQATLYGVICGTLEGATEALNTSMWIGRGFGANGFAKSLIKGGGSVKAGSVVLNAKITNLVASAIGEFAEESISYVGSWAMQRATYDKDAQFSVDEMVKQGAMGALVGLFGAGLSVGSINSDGMISDFLNTEAGMKWATGEGASTTRDLLMHTMVTESLSPETRAKLQIQEGALSVEDHDAVVRDVEQHTRQMESDQQKFDTDMGKIAAELTKKQDSVTVLTTKMEQAAADKSAAGMKKWAKIAEQYRVAQSELEVEQAQADAKRTERTAAFTETTEQHKIAISKAQQKFVGHAVSMTEAFAPEISDMGEAAKSGVIPNELGTRILSKMSAARAGKLIDYMQTKAEIQQATSPAQPAGAAQDVQAPTAQPTAENDSAGAGQGVTAQETAVESAGNIKQEGTAAISTVEDWNDAFSVLNPRHVRYDAINGWFKLDAGSAETMMGDPEYSVIGDGESVSLIPSENNLMLSGDTENFFDIKPLIGVERADSFVVTNPASLERYGAYYRVTGKGEIQLTNQSSQVAASTQAEQPKAQAQATPANPAEMMGLSGISVGAMTSKKGLSEGRTAISQFFTNTLDNMNLDGHTQDALNAMMALDEVGTYDVVSEKESIAKAQEKLARGITPELLEELRSTNAWGGVEADTAMGILAQYEQNGKDTGDYTDYYNWLIVMQDRLSEGGRGIQALAKYTRDTKVQAVMTASKNVKKSDKAATPKQKSKVKDQTDKIARVVDDAIQKNATPDTVESEVTKVAKKETAKTIRDAFVRLQNKQIDRKAFDEQVNKAVKQENGLTGFTTEDAKRVIELLDLAEQQTDGYERRRYQSMAAQIIANTEPVTFGEKFRSVQRIMMLLNPRTMIRNVAANVVFAPFEWAKDLPATLVDMLVSRKTGERTTTVSLQKQAAAIGGFKRGVSEVGKDIKYGVNTSKSTGKYEMTAKDVWRGKFMNFLDDMVGYGLNAGDRPFYEAAYDEFAMNEKLLGHDIDSDEVQERIVNLSLDRVFQGSPAIFEGMKRIRNGIDQFAPPFGTLLIPFTQTPANLADKILDYSVGIVRAGKQLYDASKTGGKFDQKMFVDRIGRAITGNGLMILGYALAKAGIINMAGGDDKERQAMKNAGVTAYSVQLGDASIAINWAEPVGSIMLMGATLAQQGANGESLNVIEGGKMMFNSFFDNSIFSNLTALFGGGYGDTASGIENFALGTSTQFLPSTLAAIARTFDPYERDTYDPNKLLSQGKRILSYFPGLRNALPFKYGSDGQPVESNYGGDFFGRMLNTMVNPALVDQKSGDAVNDEIYRLYQGGYTDQLLPVAAKTISNVKLSASQRRELQQMLGEATYNAAQRIIASGQYQALTDDQKVEALADAVDGAAQDARDAFKRKLGN